MCFNPRAHAGRDIISKSWRQRKWFQSTRPRGARLFRNFWFRASLLCFNPRAHAGRDSLPAAVGSVAEFQSTRPRGARHDCKCLADYIMYVSIHAPTRGATALLQTLAQIHLSFNPRAHAGRDSGTFSVLSHALVSIHAPTRGATVLELHEWVVFVVSIHAPTRGATPSSTS